MKLNSIMCPTDFSRSSDAALGYASALAAETKATLFIVHVSEDTPAYLAGYGGFTYVPDVPDSIETEMRKKLDNTKPTRSDVNVERHFLTGPPVSEIVEFANREKVDLIVLGTHGRTGLSRVLMGSIAEGVLRKASCPVLTVKSPISGEDNSNATEDLNQKHVTPARSKFSHH